MRKNCLNCAHFKMSEKPPRMRGCQCPTKISMNGVECGNWKPLYGSTDKFLAWLTHRKLPKRSLVI